MCVFIYTVSCVRVYLYAYLYSSKKDFTSAIQHNTPGTYMYICVYIFIYIYRYIYTDIY